MAIFCGLVFGKVRANWTPNYCVRPLTVYVPALGNSKGVFIETVSREASLTFASAADIIKMIDSQPELAGQIRRVRGGYLKIQGTWMPYEVRRHLMCIVNVRLIIRL